MTLHPAPVLSAAVDAALRAIPPAFPLSATVAVNPYLGQASLDLAHAAAQLADLAGAPTTLPRAALLDRIARGEIADADLADALDAAPVAQRPASVAALKAAAAEPAPARAPLPTVAGLAARATGADWPGLVADRFGAWASGYLDAGQALWTAPGGDAWHAWRAWASHDLSPEIMGLTGFAARVADAPDDADGAIAAAVAALALPPAAVERYLTRLLFTLGGWAQAARGALWRAELEGRTDATLRGMLAAAVTWEAALRANAGGAIAADWAAACAAYALPPAPDAAQVVDAILQEAAERAAQRRLAETLGAPAPKLATDARPALQAAFCIDVRSEPFRRAFESLDPGVRTLGFAGFFGLPVAHRQFASDVEEARAPVLLAPPVHSRAGGEDGADGAARIARRAVRAWGRFRQAAVSSFAFVEAAGPIYAAKLARDALRLTGLPAAADPAPRLDPALDVETRAGMAESALRGLGLTKGFARLVLIVGHGATVANNPFASALQCGACGGHSGEANARLLAGLLNDPAVRAALATRGVEIPADALFLGGLHDTTADTVTLFDGDAECAAHAADLAAARRWLAEAGRMTRAERALTLPRAGGAAGVARRGRDWAELRPEWGLAGCAAFIAAPRARTTGRDLGGRAFLHDYDWRADEGFGVLETILTAPVVVASWISLQYYGSSIAPETFGSGDKLLHNVVGGIGVIEGAGGLLRTGLPMQSVHDGEAPRHDALRLAVCVEAPTEAMTEILRRHPGVRALFDNRWLHLLALDETGRFAARYEGGLTWRSLDGDVVRSAA
jgi:uncharacterized protein YbcC (UPF0753/DUF2309 family)